MYQRKTFLASSIAMALCAVPALAFDNLPMRGGASLRLSYDNADDVPSEYIDLYTETDGKFVLTGVVGIKTDADIARLQESLRKEREAHKATKAKFSAFADMDPDEVQSKLDRIEELELAAGGALDQAKIDQLVETRIKARIAPLERENKKLKEELDGTKGLVEQFTTKERTRTVHDHIRSAALKLKVRDTAVEDILVLGERVFETTEDGQVVTRDGVGVTPGLSPEVWLTDQQNNRPHWWPESTGVGAQGNLNKFKGADNPFSADGWNLTAQGMLVRSDRAKAEQMAKAAGTTIGGQRPVKK